MQKVRVQGAGEKEPEWKIKMRRYILILEEKAAGMP